ncbi:MAG: ArsR family transcriptional regulator [Verrucomicrobiaceae bacterium]|nr:ArsR family transcriptional regulator [Verrucomicrobiaceae bacterium]
MSTQTARPLTPAVAALDSSALAAYCKAGGDPLRLEILRLLSRDSYGVLELSRILDMPQSGMSHHLKILAKAGLVATRREGNSIFYRRAPLADSPELEILQRALFASVDQLALDDEIDARIAAVQAERTRYSQQFFAENAGRFRQQQELIAAFDVYGPQAAEMLGQCFPSGGELALEVGPGEGAFLAELAPRFRRVLALDNAPAMLKQAQSFARKQALTNIEFIEGDTGAPALRERAVDCAILNMVLHHVPSPAHLFEDLARVLRPAGSLLVTELCRHDQQWAEQACGDVWLGFEPDDLTQWAQAAGFSAGRSVYLAQRNGFRVQIRQFVRTG